MTFVSPAKAGVQSPGADEWQLADANYKWWPGYSSIPKGYFHKDVVITYDEGGTTHTWEWNGSAWVETTPTPDPEPSTSV